MEEERRGRKEAKARVSHNLEMAGGLTPSVEQASKPAKLCEWRGSFKIGFCRRRKTSNQPSRSAGMAQLYENMGIRNCFPYVFWGTLIWMKIRKEPNYSLSLSQQNSKFFLVPVLTVVEDIRVAPSQWAERERQHKRESVLHVGNSGRPRFSPQWSWYGPWGYPRSLCPSHRSRWSLFPLAMEADDSIRGCLACCHAGRGGEGVLPGIERGSQSDPTLGQPTKVLAKYANSSHIR